MANERRLGILWTFLKILASIVLLLWLYATIDWTQFARTVRTIPSQLLATGLLVAFLGQLLCAWRLRVLLHAQSINVRYGFNVRLTFLGLFAGNFLPSTIGGDALKIVLLARRGYGTPASVRARPLHPAGLCQPRQPRSRASSHRRPERRLGLGTNESPGPRRSPCRAAAGRHGRPRCVPS